MTVHPQSQLYARAASWTCDRIRANGIELAVRTAGPLDAPAVLFLHGWPQTGQCWGQVVEALEARVQAIAPDLRGFGDSDKPPAGYGMDVLADDAASVMDALDVSQAIVVAHDVGGPAAWALAATRPERVAAVLFLETPFLGVAVPGAENFVTRFWHLLLHQDVDLACWLIGGRERGYLDWFMRHFAADPDRATAGLDLWAAAMAAPGALRGGFEHYRAMPANAERAASLLQTSLGMPVMAWGASRVMGSYCLEAARHVAPHAQGGVIEDCGHWIPEEQPTVIADLVKQLLRSLQCPNP